MTVSLIKSYADASVRGRCDSPVSTPTLRARYTINRLQHNELWALRHIIANKAGKFLASAATHFLITSLPVLCNILTFLKLNESRHHAPQHLSPDRLFPPFLPRLPGGHTAGLNPSNYTIN